MHWDGAAMLTTVFMVAAVCYWITRPHAISSGGPFSKSQVAGVILVMALGLATSFLPLARTSVPVAGQTEWSGGDIVLRVDAWKGHPSPEVLGIASSYFLMLLAAAVAFLPRPRNPLLVISLLGIICSSWALEMGHSLLFDWFIYSGGTVRKVEVSYAAGMYAPVIAMSALLLIAANQERS